MNVHVNTLLFTQMHLYRLNHSCSNILHQENISKECVPHQKQNGGMQGYIYDFFAPKHKIVGASLNRLGEAVITCTHNLCFEHE